MNSMAPFEDTISVLESAKVYYWNVFKFEEVCVREHEAMGMSSAELAELEMVLT